MLLSGRGGDGRSGGAREDAFLGVGHGLVRGGTSVTGCGG
jgi:hypothetical protein